MSKKAFIYEFIDDETGQNESGEFEAEDQNDAFRQLRVKYMRSELPEGSTVVEKEIAANNLRQAKSGKLRRLLVELASHYQWQRGELEGRRANLTGLDFNDLDLRGKDFSNAEMAGVNLSGSDLSGANLKAANLVHANLRDADLRGANLHLADLSDADLRGADLTGADLSGIDLWRANLLGCVIAPEKLHGALRCKIAEQ